MRDVRIPGLRRILRISWSKEGVARDVDEEIRFHLDTRIEELVRQGLPLREARERAEAEYGDVADSRRELVDVDRRRLGQERREELLMSFVDDVAFAVRGLLRRPALLVVTTLTLSIGIAANAIMFGVVDELLLRPPPHIAAPDRVKRIYYHDVAGAEVNIGSVTTYPVVTALRRQTTAFAQVAAFGFPADWSVGSGASARGVRAQLVSGNYFRLLGASPQLGRSFTDDEDRIPVGDRVAIVSDGFWRDELGSRPDAIGLTLLLQGKPYTLVGVAPRGFTGVDRDKVDVWVPISSVANETMGPGWHNTANSWWAQIIVRLRDSVTADVATTQSTAAYRRLVAEWNEKEIRDTTSSIVLGTVIGTRAPDGVSPESKVSLWLMGVSIIVLLIACANVANLLLARTIERQREIAVRMALGISRGRLAQLLLAEAMVLATIAATIAMLVTYTAGRLVKHSFLPNIVWSGSVLDGRMLAFTTGATVLCVLLAGLAPVLHGVGVHVSNGLKASARQVTSSRGALRFSLLAVQAALSVILLVGSGLFVRSLRNVVSRDIGIDVDRVFKVEMPLRRFGFDSAQVDAIYQRAVERLRLLPGVTSVAVPRLTVPMGSASAVNFQVPGATQHSFSGGGPYNAIVTPGYFATVGTSIVMGRDFTPAEARVPSRVAIVNEIIAKGYWPNANPIGQCVKLGQDSTCSQIVGVAKNVVQFGVVADDRAIVYSPPNHPGFRSARPSAILVRVAASGEHVRPMIRRELQALAPNMPFVQVRLYSELIAPQLQSRRLGAAMFTLFGFVAVIIAAIGLYSVMAYWVSQRTHEIGVRMALGAQRADVLRLVAAQSLRAVLAGLALGGGVALVASRWVADMLYETSPRDPAVYAVAAVVLGLAGVIASIVPARRSTAVEPARAMRAD